MENWKVALVSGAAGVGTAMFLKKKWTAGIILAGVGLATLASEYPEKFAEVRRRPAGLHRARQQLPRDCYAGGRPSGGSRGESLPNLVRIAAEYLGW